jgi:amidase
MGDDFGWLDGTALADLVRAGEVKPIDLVDAAIARIEARNPRLNAVITPLFEKARTAAATGAIGDGPFRGVPFLIKDAVCHTAGDPYYAGSRFLRDAGWCADDDTWLAARFRTAGLVTMGRTNTPEFATSATTEPLAFGPTRNPWDVTRSPGGSSGGSAAAVAAGMVPIAHGNDMGGSIRIPAGWCGLVGLKPTRGRSTLGPHRSEYWADLTHEHVITRSVRDTAAVLDAVAGPGRGDPYTAPPPYQAFASAVGEDPGRLRIGFRTHRPDTGEPSHPECVAAIEDAARLLGDLGHHVEPDPLTCLDGWDGLAGLGTVIAVWLAVEIDAWTERLGQPVDLAQLEPQNRNAVERGRSLGAADYVRALESMHAYARRACAWNERFDVLLLPTACTPPPPIGVLGPLQTEDDPVYDRRGPAVFTLPFDVTGEPAISVPLHWTADSLPIGTQLVAPYGREDVLIRLASQLESARPWAHRHPPVEA